MLQQPLDLTGTARGTTPRRERMLLGQASPQGQRSGPVRPQRVGDGGPGGTQLLEQCGHVLLDGTRRQEQRLSDVLIGGPRAKSSATCVSRGDSLSPYPRRPRPAGLARPSSVMAR
jgi:hypothetical protein